MDKDVDFSKLVAGSSKGVEGEECHAFRWLQVKSIDEGKRQVTALASTVAIDRDGDVVPPEVIKRALPGYMQNPVILAAHQPRLDTGHSSVVGNTVKAWVDKQGLWIVVEFVKGTELGEEYWLLYSQKVQRAFSIGYRLLKSHSENVQGRRVNVFDDMELLEISCVPVPANPEALSKARKAKQSFIEAKRREKEQNRFMAELKADPEFDEKCDEYAKALLGLDGNTLPDAESGEDYGEAIKGGEDIEDYTYRPGSSKAQDQGNGFYDDEPGNGVDDVMEFAALVKGRERGYYERLDWEKMEKGFKLPSRS